MKVREDQPVFSDGTVDLDAWLARIESKVPIVDAEELGGTMMTRLAELFDENTGRELRSAGRRLKAS